MFSQTKGYILVPIFTVELLDSSADVVGAHRFTLSRLSKSYKEYLMYFLKIMNLNCYQNSCKFLLNVVQTMLKLWVKIQVNQTFSDRVEGWENDP